MNKNFFITALLIMALLSAGCGIEGKNKNALSEQGKTGQTGTETTAKVSKSAKKKTFKARQEELLKKYSDMHIKLTVTDPGSDVYLPKKGGALYYRYGPSMLLEEDGGIGMYFAAPGNSGKELDWITYQHSDDGGKTWSDEKVVLSPTPLSRDELSVCDPDAFYHDGYYYIGYTSTLDATKQGIVNSVYLARSENPDGPFEKWDGSGWGGDPEPIIYYDGVWNGGGTGEPSFVILDDTIYVYCTRDAYDAENVRIKTTEVYTADISDDEWPGSLRFEGYAVDRTDTDMTKDPDADYIYSDSDSWDVAYLEEYGKFVALSTNRRFKNNSCLLYYESNDGINFERVSELNTNVCCGCHNSGIMADGEGHIRKGDQVKLGYAYDGKGNSSWGTWAARIAPVSVEVTRDIDRSEEEAENLKVSIDYGSRSTETYPFFITADSRVKTAYLGGSAINTSYAWIDLSRSSHMLNPSDMELSGYDESVISVKDGVITPVGEGLTSITIGYKGITRQIRMRVFPVDQLTYSRVMSVEDLFSPVEEYKVSLSGPYAVAIRPLMRYNDYTLSEITYTTLISRGLTFESQDPEICTVRADGLIMPVAAGETQVRVTCGSGLSYMVDVEVTD